jgi:hypothetical protein
MSASTIGRHVATHFKIFPPNGDLQFLTRSNILFPLVLQLEKTVMHSCLVCLYNLRSGPNPTASWLRLVIYRRVPRIRAGYIRGGWRAGRRIRRVRVNGFFFQNRILFVSYLCPSWVHGYHGYGYGGTWAHRAGTRVLDYSGMGFVITVSEPL